MEWYLLVSYALILGLLIGSFLNVVILRLPKAQSLAYPGSHCTSCGTPIRAYDNIPVLSWLILRGKCRACKSPISSLYPTIELLMGLLSVLIFLRVIPDASYLTWVNGGAFVLYLAFVAMLVAETFIDIRYFIIPDELSIYPVPLAILAAYGLAQGGYAEAIGWKASVLGAFFGGGILVLIAVVWWLLRRIEGMGLGDAKLLALIGAVLGPWPALPFILFISACSAMLVMIPFLLWKGKGFRYALPFGPFLAFAAVVWVLHGQELVRFWLPGAELIFINL